MEPLCHVTAGPPVIDGIYAYTLNSDTSVSETNAWSAPPSTLSRNKQAQMAAALKEVVLEALNLISLDDMDDSMDDDINQEVNGTPIFSRWTGRRMQVHSSPTHPPNALSMSSSPPIILNECQESTCTPPTEQAVGEQE